MEQVSEGWLNGSYSTARLEDRAAGQALMAGKIVAMDYEGLCEAAEITPETIHAEA